MNTSRWVSRVETTWDEVAQLVMMREVGQQYMAIDPYTARRLALDLLHASANCIQGIGPCEAAAAGRAAGAVVSR